MAADTTKATGIAYRKACMFHDYWANVSRDKLVLMGYRSFLACYKTGVGFSAAFRFTSAATARRAAIEGSSG